MSPPHAQHVVGKLIPCVPLHCREVFLAVHEHRLNALEMAGPAKGQAMVAADVVGSRFTGARNEHLHPEILALNM